MRLVILVLTFFACTDDARRVHLTFKCQLQENQPLQCRHATSLHSLTDSTAFQPQTPGLLNAFAALLVAFNPAFAFNLISSYFPVGHRGHCRKTHPCVSRRCQAAPQFCVWEIDLDDIKPVSKAKSTGSSRPRAQTGRGRSKQGGGRSQQRTGVLRSSSETRKGVLSVAVIGGGIAGLSCAQHLQETGRFYPVVFDTGRLRPGGRCSSRLPGDSKKLTEVGKQIVDHAAQILTASISQEFAEQVSKWEHAGVLTRFPAGSVVEVCSAEKEDGPVPSFEVKELNGHANGQSHATDEDSPAMYYGTRGMGSIAATIASEAGLQVEQDVWVSPSNGVMYAGENEKPLWQIKAKGQVLGEFDRLVIAHNGKCADRLMSKTPAKKLHSLLRVNFAASVPADGGKKMTLNSIYSLIFAVEKGKSPLSNILPANVMSAFIKNEPTLRFISCNSRKYKEGPSEIEVYTVLSSAKFASKHKAPQEAIPQNVSKQVTTLLLQAVERAFSLEDQSLSGDGVLLDSRLQLWGAAVPLNTWAESPGFLFDDKFGVGACGDWLLDPSLEGAWESGRRLAKWMDHSVKENIEAGSTSVGLPPSGQFKPSRASLETGLGSFGTHTPSSVR